MKIFIFLFCIKNFERIILGVIKSKLYKYNIFTVLRFCQLFYERNKRAESFEFLANFAGEVLYRLRIVFSLTWTIRWHSNLKTFKSFWCYRKIWLFEKIMVYNLFTLRLHCAVWWKIVYTLLPKWFELPLNVFKTSTVSSSQNTISGQENSTFGL